LLLRDLELETPIDPALARIVLLFRSAGLQLYSGSEASSGKAKIGLTLNAVYLTPKL
jgi:hypothetical protein